MSFWNDWMGGDAAPANAPSPDRDRTLILYKYDSCPYCQRVFRTIDELGLDGEVERRDIHRERSAVQELREATGRGTVPCLFIDGEPLLESTDISAWLRAYKDRGAAVGQ